ncbi:hypothetical protein QR685DRAFT_16345 [Neurospora intermedia]|uniref:Uncharacterized protein n=1 Tax=Neurospora intermedia TaxID=5142 RepID=A0ABR3DPQ4_NEUIN
MQQTGIMLLRTVACHNHIFDGQILTELFPSGSSRDLPVVFIFEQVFWNLDNLHHAFMRHYSY